MIILLIQIIKRACDFIQIIRAQVNISTGCLDGTVPKATFNDIQLYSGLKQMGCKTVTQGMDTPTPGHACHFLSLVKNTLSRGVQYEKVTD
jgi:hypothetical protein